MERKWKIGMRSQIIKASYSLSCSISLLVFLLSSLGVEAQQDYKSTTYKEGIKVEFSMTHIDPSKIPGKFTEGDDIRFRFKLSDTTSNNPLTGAFPAAWMDIAKDDGKPRPCGRRIADLIAGDVFNRAELDLNVYYVLAMNEDNTISVVDPLFSFGGSQLLAYIQLNGTGYDWKITEDQQYLFVSVPSANEVSIIRTSDWKIVKNISIPGQPKQLALQEDEHYLWVAYDNPGKFESKSGVVAINTKAQKLTKTIPTGKGRHSIATDDKNTTVFVTNESDGNISAIDVKTLSIKNQISLGGIPSSISFSKMAQAIYTLDITNRSIAVIDGSTNRVIQKIQLEMGCNKLTLDPQGKLGFVLNPIKNTVNIIDLSTNSIVQTADVEGQPDEIAFSDELAYVKHRGSEIVWMIPLDILGYEGKPVSLIDFPGGQNPPSRGVKDCIAPAIVQAPGANAVLLSNYEDKTIYYYVEGMAAPMGSFNNYGKFPKAVQVIDRSLEEHTSGVYETIAKLRKPGDYNVALFLDAPSIMECFPVTVEEDPIKKKEKLESFFGPLSIKYLPLEAKPIVGKDMKLKFQLIDLETNQPVSGLSDVSVMEMSTTGRNSDRQFAKEVGKNGTYEVNVAFQEQGMYYVYIACASRGLEYNNPQFKMLYVAENKPTTQSN